jgi:8-oxo-dGTP pyrophosphatase MutT (NUDIX family)
MEPARRPLALASIEARLRASDWGRGRRWFGEEAAVAVILRPAAEGLETLLIERAKNEGDPWSGHMAFPGGRRDPADSDIEATARRETLEEIGLDLARSARRLGRLPPEVTKAHGRLAPLTVTPVVYALEGEPGPFSLSREVARTTWLPLEEIRSGRRDAVHLWRLAGFTVPVPAWSWEGAIVWGITHRILSSLLRAAEPGA